jgi:hypothetical protein
MYPTCPPIALSFSTSASSWSTRAVPSGRRWLKLAPTASIAIFTPDSSSTGTKDFSRNESSRLLAGFSSVEART